MESKNILTLRIKVSFCIANVMDVVTGSVTLLLFSLSTYVTSSNHIADCFYVGKSFKNSPVLTYSGITARLSKLAPP